MDNAHLPKKSLGQHWLRDKQALQAMCDAAELVADDFVLEIGPGVGTLTDMLVHNQVHVQALEFDTDLIADLEKRYAGQPVEVIEGDIRSYDLTSLPASYKVVANIPYYLTSYLMQLLSETSNPPSIAALLVQKEVAERVAAQPGAMSLLSVVTQFYWKVTLDMVVPAKLFTPPPKVDSQILVLHRRQHMLVADADIEDFFRLIKAGFSQRRKTLLNSLSGGLHLSKQQTNDLCARAQIDPSRRAQTLSLDEWKALYTAYKAG